MLAPFWASRLGKTAFRARQASQRGGDVRCAVVGNRVTLAGSCAFYLQGEIEKVAAGGVSGRSAIHARPTVRAAWGTVIRTATTAGTRGIPRMRDHGPFGM